MPHVSFFVRQRKNVQSVACLRMMNIRQDGARHISRAATAKTGRDSNVLLAVDTERRWESLNRSSQSRLPQYFSVSRIHGAERAVQISYKGYAARR